MVEGKRQSPERAVEPIHRYALGPVVDDLKEDPNASLPESVSQMEYSDQLKVEQFALQSLYIEQSMQLSDAERNNRPPYGFSNHMVDETVASLRLEQRASSTRESGIQLSQQLSRAMADTLSKDFDHLFNEAIAANDPRLIRLHKVTNMVQNRRVTPNECGRQIKAGMNGGPDFTHNLMTRVIEELPDQPALWCEVLKASYPVLVQLASENTIYLISLFKILQTPSGRYLELQRSKSGKLCLVMTAEAKQHIHEMRKAFKEHRGIDEYRDPLDLEPATVTLRCPALVRNAGKSGTKEPLLRMVEWYADSYAKALSDSGLIQRQPDTAATQN